MKNKKIHIISFDIPWPDNYGGVIDVYHKIRWLSRLSWEITLHCFHYGRPGSMELERLCKKVFYYPRNTNKTKLISPLPFIVNTRIHDELAVHLLADDATILFEGLHTTALLSHPAISERKTMVRTHNIEHEYYQQLHELESHFFKKIYYKSEAVKLKKYEQVLTKAGMIAAISETDYAYFNKAYGHTFYLPAFHRYDRVISLTGKGSYCLFHGNLSVAENHIAAMWLLENILPLIRLPLVIAGQHARPELRTAAGRSPLIKLIENPDPQTMFSLIQDAQVHLLPAFQNSGIKLKLLHALFCGRHVVTNEMMAGHGSLKDLCLIAESPLDFAEKVLASFKIEFRKEDISHRWEILKKTHSNEYAASVLEACLQATW